MATKPKGAKKKGSRKPEPPVIPIERLRASYDLYLTDQMGHLHNQFVAFISEGQIPLPHVLMVLEMLVDETKEMARKKYLGE